MTHWPWAGIHSPGDHLAAKFLALGANRMYGRPYQPPPLRLLAGPRSPVALGCARARKRPPDAGERGGRRLRRAQGLGGGAVCRPGRLHAAHGGLRSGRKREAALLTARAVQQQHGIFHLQEVLLRGRLRGVRRGAGFRDAGGTRDDLLLPWRDGRARPRHRLPGVRGAEQQPLHAAQARRRHMFRDSHARPAQQLRDQAAYHGRGRRDRGLRRRLQERPGPAGRLDSP